jgi:hypothetical protein
LGLDSLSSPMTPPSSMIFWFCSACRVALAAARRSSLAFRLSATSSLDLANSSLTVRSPNADDQYRSILGHEPLTLLIQLINSLLSGFGRRVSNKSVARGPLAELEGQSDIKTVILVRAPHDLHATYISPPTGATNSLTCSSVASKGRLAM